MKRLFFLLTTMCTLTAKSQSSVYHPFPTTNASWNYQYYDDFHQPTWQFTQYSLIGDTVISSKSYKRVFTYFNYSGAIRENNKIIYFVPDTSSTEYLLYNFNLGLGDTLIHPYGGAVCSNDTAIVIQVDSVLASDGYHRVLWFNSFAYWIEGIGSINYFLSPCNVLCVSGNDQLLCMITDSGFSYPPGTSSCIVSVNEQSALKNKADITPNPFTANLTAIINNNDPSQITLYDLTSRKILQQSFNNTTSINTTALSKGLYLYEVRNKNGVIKKGKLVKD